MSTWDGVLLNLFLAVRWFPCRKRRRWAFKSQRSLSRISAKWRRSCSRQTSGEKRMRRKKWGEKGKTAIFSFAGEKRMRRKRKNCNFLICRCDELEQQGRRVRSDTQTRVRSLLKVNLGKLAVATFESFFSDWWSRNFWKCIWKVNFGTDIFSFLKGDPGTSTSI